MLPKLIFEFFDNSFYSAQNNIEITRQTNTNIVYIKSEIISNIIQSDIEFYV